MRKKLNIARKNIDFTGILLEHADNEKNSKDIFNFAKMLNNRDKQMKTKISGIAGIDVLKNNIYFELGDSQPHMLIFGRTGAGITSMIMTIVFSIMNSVTPEDVLIDFLDGKGNSFDFMGAYGDVKHPNPFVYSPSADGSYDYDYMQAKIIYWEREVYQRLSLFRKATLLTNDKISTLDEYNQAFPNDKLPEILIVFDEFSCSIDQSVKNNGYNASDRLEYIARNGQFAGIRLLLCDSCARKEVIPQKIMDNIKGRIALALSEPVESRNVFPSSEVYPEYIRKSGEFFSVMNGVENLEHGYSPCLTYNQLCILNDKLTEVFGNRHYIITREEVLNILKKK